jgi:hypothetical protein
VRATTVRTGGSGNVGDVEFSAAAGCRAGQQLFHMYSSDLSNAELLLSYGFTIPANENDTVLVEIEQPDEAWRVRLLPFVPQHYLTRSAPLPLQLLHAVALADCSKPELKSRLKDGAWPAPVLQRARQLLLPLLRVRCSCMFRQPPSPLALASRARAGQARAVDSTAGGTASRRATARMQTAFAFCVLTSGFRCVITYGTTRALILRDKPLYSTLRCSCCRTPCSDLGTAQP